MSILQRIAAALHPQPQTSLGMKRSTVFRVEAFDQDGNLKWAEEVPNLVTTVGLNDSLDKHFKGSNYTASWFVGLTGGSVEPAAADTMASHGGWAESTSYSDATRRPLTLGTISGGSVDNSASKAVFNINAPGTIGGAFTVDNSTKGGTTGILYGVAAFSDSRSLTSGDVLNVTVTLTAS